MLAAAEESRAGAVIGGFDATRGGVDSLSEGSQTSGLRSLIASDFAGASVTGSPTLTPSYLATLNVLILSSVYSSNSAIAALSGAEQSALDNFVLAGGTAILVSDNGASGFASAANSFMGVFGVQSAGTLSGGQQGTVTDSTSPVTNGPFGQVTGFKGDYTGTLTSLGSYATSLGTWDADGSCALAAIAPGAPGTGSGAVVFFSDANQAFDTGNAPLMLNSIALGVASVPEPSSSLMGLVALAMAGGLTLARRRPDRRHI